MSANDFRYALYLAPPPDGDLWRFGCDGIGRDALTGAPCEGFSLEGYRPQSWRNMTSDARYGFHATLKAPFPLRLDLDVPDLYDSVAEFARKHSPFDAGDIKVATVKVEGVARAGAGIRASGFVTRAPRRRADAVRAKRTWRRIRDLAPLSAGTTPPFPTTDARLGGGRFRLMATWRRDGKVSSKID